MTTAGPSRSSPSADFVGRVPPQNLEAEQAVLGCMLLDPNSVGLVLEDIRKDDFYASENQLIFEAMTRLFERNVPIDLLTLREELKVQGLLDRVGGSDYLTSLSSVVPSAANARHYSRIVRESSVLRMLIETTTMILRDAYGDRGTSRDLLDRSEQAILSIADKHSSTAVHAIRDILVKTFEAIDDIHSRKDRIQGLATGFYDLDDCTVGLHGSELIILAARPSIGKTTFALNVCRHAAVELEKAVLIFSLEMSKEQVAQNLLCCEAHVDAQQLRKGLLDESQMSMLMTAAGRLSEAPIFIDDSPGLGILEIRAKARRLKKQHDVALVVVDYLQLVDTPQLESRAQEVAQLSRGLKALARELDVPVIAISQLNRAPELREEHRPRNSDLRESGALEQDADVVLLLHREEYYQPNNPEFKNRAELIVSKQRNGPAGITVHLQFQGNILRFQNLTAQYVTPG